MLSDQIAESAIRIFDFKTNVIGCGFFFTGSVFTCAHVINHAIGVSSDSIEKPTAFADYLTHLRFE
jgi:hypothetical protein